MRQLDEATMTNHDDARRRRDTLRNAFVAFHAAARDAERHGDYKTFGFATMESWITVESKITDNLAEQSEKWNRYLQ
jgi:hypothetical protein